MGLPLRTCPAVFQTYVTLWRGHDPEGYAKSKGVNPYPEDMLPFHYDLARRIDREVLEVTADGPERQLITLELATFRALVSQLRETHESTAARLAESRPFGSPESERAASDKWSAVTTALAAFVWERRILAEITTRHGHHLAYFSEMVRSSLGIDPVIPGISVFEEGE